MIRNILNFWSKNKRTLKLLMLIAMLIGFFFYVPVKEIYTAVRSANMNLFWSSFFLGFPALYLGAIKLWFFTKKQELDLSVYKIFKINMIVRFYSFFSPASIVGSGLKWYKFSSPGKEADALLAIAVSRAWDIFLAFFFGLLWMFMGGKADFIHPAFLLLVIAILIILWFTALRYGSVVEYWLAQKAMSLKVNLFKTIFAFMENLFSSFALYKKLSLSDGFFLLSISLIAELVTLIGYTLLARALNIQISFADLGWMRSIFFLSALAPFTMAGGIGLREVSIILVMSGFGISAELAVAYSFLLYARSVLLYLVGGLVEMFSTLRKIW